MFRALYDFEATVPHTLSFNRDDKFTVIDQKHPDWWLVQNGFGEVGYVPGTYVTKDETSPISDVLKSIDRAIEAIHFSATCSGGKYTHEQRENLQKLVQHRKNVASENQQIPPQPKRQAPQPPSDLSKRGKKPSPKRGPPPPLPRADEVPEHSIAAVKHGKDHSSTVSVNAAASQSKETDTTVSTVPKKTVDTASSHSKVTNTTVSPVPKDNTPITEEGSKSENTSPSDGVPVMRRKSIGPGIDIPESLGEDLIELVRRNTKLSYELSRVAVGTVVSTLKDKIPGVAMAMEEVLKNLLHTQRESHSLEGSQDAVRLQVIFSEISACKDDSQQRGWSLYEDESVILEYLEELLSILNGANPDICRQIVSMEKYEAVDTLVVYYQMETRKSIRLQLLQVFGALCGLDAKIISMLLTTILPIELARDMQTDTDIQKLSYSSLVLTMIFSMGEPLPFHTYEHLNKTFVSFLFSSIENPLAEDVEEVLSDSYVNLILSFNLHFQQFKDNLVMQVLAERGTSKTFTEKVLLLVNREADPVRMFEHDPKPPHSVLKLFMDIFSQPETAGVLYTNDAKVLIDIVIRQITDLSPGDAMRTEYLSLIHLIFKNSDYSEHMHRSSELQSLFMKVSREEAKESEMDKLIVQQIWSDFPQYFGSAV
ncbi:NCK-interacting protein with SH3 domain-like [Lingula anatina]|uniref:NCK-interacting protein with SH3 domain-like n=1 Tax=Lingula anatina TaxID=7574 RepID=A0A1S3I518_LINAN|nr:NCK-interacting protein with SH3 domain-like [Lingula anatina]|eukprot:XP_013393365.1 NCK-interacting protein with SH3 domain-like [Lingula anatina]